MPKPTGSAVVRKFLDGTTIDDLVNWTYENGPMQEWEARGYVEDCIRRALNRARKLKAVRR